MLVRGARQDLFGDYLYPEVRLTTTFQAFALVAQGIEHRFPKPGVAGSNPAEGAHPCFPLYSLTFWR